MIDKIKIEIPSHFDSGEITCKIRYRTMSMI